MNEKIKRYRADYERNEEKITALQAKSKKLLSKITQLENEEIIGLVRESRLSINELAAFLKRHGAPPANTCKTEGKEHEFQS